MTKTGLILTLILLIGVLRTDAHAEPAGSTPFRPTIFIAGDSTAERSAGDQQGWGGPLVDYFDRARVRVANCARAGRSSRTFISEGLWDRLLNELHAGDIVLIQFGFNDSGAVNDEPPPPPARGSLPGIGDQTREIANVSTGKRELVHTYGWYLRKMIADTRAKSALPVVLGLTLRNIWRNGRIERGLGQYRAWSARIAEEAHVPFIDVTNLMADKFEALGQRAVTQLYLPDQVHFNALGADQYASLIVTRLRELPGNPLKELLSNKGVAVTAIANGHPNVP